MTRDEITSAVTTLVGQVDSTAVSICNTLLQRRYAMIYDAALWKDSQMTVAAVTVNGTDTVQIPVALDRVISVLCNGDHFLDPADSTFFIQTDPTVFITPGVPQAYEEITDTLDSNKRKIRLFPVPDAAYSLKVVGKRLLVNLTNGSDTPLIRNIDNVLMTFLVGDMWTRMRQTGKAQEKYAEATAMLTAAKALDAEQVNRPRSAKTPSVSTGSLGELADAVCSKVGNWALDSVILAKDFIRRRYRHVYDSYLWRDSVIKTTASCVNGQDYIAMPGTVIRVISIQCQGVMLEPADSITLMQTQPTLFTDSGIPTFFEEYDESGAKRIRLLPIPDSTYSLTIVGKKPADSLSTTSSVPALRNMDNVLVLYGAADLAGRLGDSARSATLQAEAEKELAAITELEAQQAFRARKAKPLTVSGNSLSEMADAVCARAGTFTLDNLVLAKDFLRRNYQFIYDLALWPESKVAVSVNSDGEQMILPEYMDRVLKVRGTATLGQLSGAAMEEYFDVAPGIFETTDTSPVAYSLLTPVGVSILPPTNERLSLSSSSATDKSSVFVRGETLGIEVSESVTLNGTTPVQTTNTYDIPLTVSKNRTTGNLTVAGATSGTVLETILANERERKHIRLWMQPRNPGVTMTCLVLGKRKIKPLLQDEDTPILRDIANPLITLSTADLLGVLGKSSDSADFRTRAEKQLQAMIDLETNQTGIQQRIVPEGNYYYNEDYDLDMAFISK